ncbi:MAG: NUDIX hydrolase [Chloroflexi bacterium]|nr:NUDIX hydrolase [Chloroflexota bacterium]
MSISYDPQWLQWARQLQAIAQSGLAYTKNPYDIERYEAIRTIAVDMMANGSTADLKHVLDLFAGQVGYATPKIDTRGVVFLEDMLLLVKEAEDGCWTLPGGWADVNESPSETVAREIFEESGFETRVVKLLAVYDRSKHPHTPPHPFHTYKLFFRCEIIGGAATKSMETEAVGFFREDDIPELSISRVTSGQIARLFEHHRHPDWPTDFD